MARRLVAPDRGESEPVFTLHRRDLPESIRERSAPFRTRHQIQAARHRRRERGGSLRFAVIGDCGQGRFAPLRMLRPYQQEFERILVEVGRADVDFAIQLGDLMRVGSIEEYNHLLSILETYCEVPFLTVLGNHDRSAPHLGGSASLYRSFFGKPNYSFKIGGVRFFIVDSSTGRLRDEQLAWLEDLIDPEERTFVFTHMPPTALEWSHVGPVKLGGLGEGGQEFLDVLASRGVERVFFGHLHHFDWRDYRGMRCVLTGSGGSPFVQLPGLPSPFYSYLMVESEGSEIRETIVKLDAEEEELPRHDAPEASSLPFDRGTNLFLQ